VVVLIEINTATYKAFTIEFLKVQAPTRQYHTLALEASARSEYKDLLNHRIVNPVALALGKAEYEVVMMEEYPARNAIVEFACKGDVAACDAYVGIFAWRYGHVPKDNNPERKSVTGLDYSAAENQISR
jgi:hypothetical protein